MAWFLPIFLGVFSTPIIVRGLGTEEYGVYAIILGFLSYSFTFGVGRVAVKYVAEFKASGNDEGISQAVSAALLFSIAVGLIGAVALSFFTPWIVGKFLILPEPIRAEAEVGLYLASFAGVVVMISQVFQSCLQGIHRFGTYALISNLNAVLLSVGVIVLAMNGSGMVDLVAWNLFSVVVTGVLFFVAAIRAMPGFRPTIKIGSDLRKATLKYGGNIILYQLFGNCLFIFERSWIVRNFNPETLTFYVVPMLIGIYLHGLVSSFSLVIFPRINELLDDRERLIQLYERSNRIIVAIVIMIVATLAACGRSFLAVWVGPEFEASSYWLLGIHSVTFGLIAIFIIPWGIAEAFHAASINVAITLTWLIIGVGLLFIFGTSIGIEGVALARLASVVLTLPVILYIENRFLGRTLFSAWLTAVLKIIPASILMYLAQSFVLKYLGASWAALVIAILLGLIIYSTVLYFIGFLARSEITEFTEIWFRRSSKV